jgi:translation initiation factor IF-2
MAKMRIYELAKELDVKPKELLAMLETIGVTGKVPSSSIEDTAARSLRQMVTNKNNPQPEPEAAPEPAAPAKASTFKSFRASDFRDARAAANRPVTPAPAAPAKPSAPVAASTPSTPLAKAPEKPVEAKAPEAKPVAEKAPIAKATAKTTEAKPAATKTAPIKPAAEKIAEDKPAAEKPAAKKSAKAATPQAGSTPAADAPVAAPPAAPEPEPAPLTEAQRIENEKLADPNWTPSENVAPAPAPSAPNAPLSAAQRRPLGPGRRPGSGRGGDFRRFDNRRGGGRVPGERDERFDAPEPEEPELEAGSIVMVPPVVTVAELAEKILKPPSELIKKLFAMKIMRSANQVLENDVASQLLGQFGYKMEVETARSDRHIEEEEDFEALETVPPVVTVMGHVDHGKTSLLDVIRSANVQSGEAGGITQRIGAYETEHNGERIVFLDTPGHEAFTRMRARGAHVTDLAILVVAADDGVMPQTREAIDHARAAKVPVIIAINKMDKAGADPNHVKTQLAEVGLATEDYGGDTVSIPVSAKTGQGVQDLLDMVLLMAELQELKANPHGLASGTIIEAQQDPQRGSIATVLIHRGTLNVGDYIVVGEVYGRVRAMFNHKGESVKKAGPKTPVSVIGLGAVPHASDTLVAVENAKAAREQAEAFTADKQRSLVEQSRVTLQDVFAKIQQGEIKELNVIVKADGQGSVEAMCQSLEKMAHEEVRVKIVSRGVGAVNENDVNLASASNGIIIAFDVPVDSGAASLADREKVEVREYAVIYDAIDDVKAALEGLLTPMYESKLSGEAEVVALFESSRAGKIAGCRIRSGKLVAGGNLKVLRKGELIFDGKLDSLRHNKDVVREMSAPAECGVSAHNFNDFQPGDMLQCFIQVQIKRTI